MFKTFTMAALTAAIASAGSDGKCRALALSGGSNNGAWEVGVMWGLVHYGDPADFAWDTISGVSAGAINTAATSVFATGDEVNMTEFLSDAWLNLTSSDIWKKRPEGIVLPIFNQPSILDSSPAIEFITNLLAPQKTIKRLFTCSATDANTGDYY